MVDGIRHMTMRQAALVSGIAYLAMFVPAIFANFFVLSGLVESGDAAVTYRNITEHELLFRGGTASLLIVAILDIVVAIGLYVFLSRANKSISLFAAWLRVAYAAIFAASIVNLAMIPGMLTTTGAPVEELQRQIMLSVDAFETGWMTGLLFFGVHLLATGYLVIRSDNVPKVFGILLIIASAGYLVDSMGRFLVPDYGLEIGQYTFVGELLFPIWLVLRGGRQG